MKKNFSICSMVELLLNGKKYDLHNEFDAMRIEHQTMENALTIVWAGGGNSDDDDSIVSVHFAQLKSLQLKGIDEEMPRREDSRLSFMGYLRPDDDSMDGFLPEDLSDENYPMIFCFEGGLTLKVLAATATMRLGY